MFRSHTGRTCRVYNDPVQTEANFIASGSEVAGGLGDSTFGTSRNTRMLAAEEYDSDVSEPRKAKLKQSGWYLNIKIFIFLTVFHGFLVAIVEGMCKDHSVSYS